MDGHARGTSSCSMAMRGMHIAFAGANGFPAGCYAPVMAELRSRGYAVRGHDCFPAMLPSLAAGRSESTLHSAPRSSVAASERVLLISSRHPCVSLRMLGMTGPTGATCVTCCCARSSSRCSRCTAHTLASAIIRDVACWRTRLCFSPAFASCRLSDVPAPSRSYPLLSLALAKTFPLTHRLSPLPRCFSIPRSPRALARPGWRPQACLRCGALFWRSHPVLRRCSAARSL